jgi:hypothetical protein
MTAEQEEAALKAQTEQLSATLEDIQKRIEELEQAREAE